MSLIRLWFPRCFVLAILEPWLDRTIEYGLPDHALPEQLHCIERDRPSRIACTSFLRGHAPPALDDGVSLQAMQMASVLTRRPAPLSSVDRFVSMESSEALPYWAAARETIIRDFAEEKGMFNLAIP
eukprot:s1106_g18.t1